LPLELMTLNVESNKYALIVEWYYWGRVKTYIMARS